MGTELRGVGRGYGSAPSTRRNSSPGAGSEASGAGPQHTALRPQWRSEPACCCGEMAQNTRRVRIKTHESSITWPGAAPRDPGRRAASWPEAWECKDQDPSSGTVLSVMRTSQSQKPDQQSVEPESPPGRSKDPRGGCTVWVSARRGVQAELERPWQNWRPPGGRAV